MVLYWLFFFLFMYATQSTDATLGKGYRCSFMVDLQEKKERILRWETIPPRGSDGDLASIGLEKQRSTS